MTKAKILRGACIVTAAMFGTVLGTATAAHADAESWLSVAGFPKGHSYFIADGDKFKVCDDERDGNSVYVEFSYIRIDGTRQTGRHEHGGAGSCATFDHNFGEGRDVWFRTCLNRDLRPDPCNVTISTKA